MTVVSVNPPKDTYEIEIIEDADYFVITVAAPHVEREDWRVDVSPARVVLSALDYERPIVLPARVKPEIVVARYNFGLLEVILSKEKPGGVGVYRL